ncbi:unnamed protein product [Camellia sinensis]
MFGQGLESVSKELEEHEEYGLELLELEEEYFQLEEEEYEEYGLESLLEELVLCLTSTDFPGPHIHECFAFHQPVYNKRFLHATVIVWCIWTFGFHCFLSAMLARSLN